MFPHRPSQPARWISCIAVALALASCELAPVERLERLEQLFEQIPPVTRIGREPPAEPTDEGAQSSATVAMETWVYEQINEIRQQEGLKPLQPNGQLAQAARQYSQRMADENFFGHVSPTGDMPAQRVSEANIAYSMVGENLFTSTNAPDPAPLAVQGWMDSPGH
jgi:uncharacterized protein YkwD